MVGLAAVAVAVFRRVDIRVSHAAVDRRQAAPG